MRNLFIKLFWPILRCFETDKAAINYKKSHRLILYAVGFLFLVLSTISAVAAYYSGQTGALIPVLVFFCAGTVTIVVGALGSDAAVSKIWGNR